MLLEREASSCLFNFPLLPGKKIFYISNFPSPTCNSSWTITWTKWDLVSCNSSGNYTVKFWFFFSDDSISIALFFIYLSSVQSNWKNLWNVATCSRPSSKLQLEIWQARRIASAVHCTQPSRQRAPFSFTDAFALLIGFFSDQQNDSKTNSSKATERERERAQRPGWAASHGRSCRRRAARLYIYYNMEGGRRRGGDPDGPNFSGDRPTGPWISTPYSTAEYSRPRLSMNLLTTDV